MSQLNDSFLYACLFSAFRKQCSFDLGSNLSLLGEFWRQDYGLRDKEELRGMQVFDWLQKRRGLCK